MASKWFAFPSMIHDPQTKCSIDIKSKFFSIFGCVWPIPGLD